MCGIVGIVSATPDPQVPDVTARMAGTLAHRGPDDLGVATRGRGGIGCQRLAIVDLRAGVQPTSNEAGDVVAVCNGEIYNHEALRRDLVARGHVFRTRSDAEVLPHLYEERGPDLVHDLTGMFAFAIWDARRSRLVLARDRMGEKPLYYARGPGSLLFASEPKAILAARAGADPDWQALAAYLRGGYVPAPLSAFSGLSKLPPGGRLVLEGEHVREDRYWSVVDALRSPALALDRDEAERELRARLETAVRGTLMGDVPVGVFLSGGLDSTVVASVARRLGADVATFSLGFEEAGFDESSRAAAAARALGTRHRSLTITPDLFLRGLGELVPLLDEPLADPALVPTFLLARLARTDVKAVLVGEGSDEVFAGYPSYMAVPLAAWYRRLPAPVRATLTRAAPRLGASTGNTTPRYLLRRFLEAGDMPPAVRHREWMGYVGAGSFAALARPDGPLAPPAELPVPEARTELDTVLGLDLAHYLPECLLTKVDRATMAASLEGRAPFLDHHLVEFACRLPAPLKLRGVVTKRVLRGAVRDLVPASVLRRVKRGLTVPLSPWMAGPLLPFVRDTLGRLDARVFRRDVVHELLDDHVARRRDNRRELWALVMLQLWSETWCGQAGRAPRSEGFPVGA
jgi:asparagine synthase (glutamine-hydrolysing)